MAAESESPERPAASAGSADKLDPALVRLAAIVLLGAVTVQLDTTIVTVAIDTLGQRFSAPLSTVQWVTTGYLLAMAVVVPLSGWAMDRFGAKQMWLFSLTAFLAGSVLCGLAWNVESLVAFRVVQGIGGGLILPLMQSIVAQAAGPTALRRLMGVIAVPSMVAPVLGPVLGGVIVDQLSWRWVFFVNVPVCAAALYAAVRGMPAGSRSEAHRLDVLGLALLSPALALVVFGLSEAGVSSGFGHAKVMWPLLGGVALLAGFVVHALRTRIEPIIDLRLFRAKAFAASAGMMFLFGISLFGGLFLVPLFDQQVRGLSPAEAGLMLAPQGIGMGLMLVVVGRFASGASARTIAAVGLVLAAVGTLPYTQADATTNGVVLGLSLALRGAGIGAAFVAVMTASYHGLPRASIPRATSAVRIFQQVGASLGTAVLAVVVSRQAAGAVDLRGLAAAYGHAFWWTVGLTALAAPLVALLPAGRPTDEQPTMAQDSDSDTNSGSHSAVPAA